MKQSDGKYHMSGSKFDMLVGSRAQVWHGTAYKTSGDLKKGDLMMNKHGRIVSKKKHATAKREQKLGKRLFKNYTAKKGKFGAVKKNGTRQKKMNKKKGKKTKGKK